MESCPALFINKHKEYKMNREKVSQEKGFYKEPSQKKPLLVSIREAAEMFSVSTRTIYRLIASKVFTVVRVGRSSRILYQELLAYIEKQGGII